MRSRQAQSQSTFSASQIWCRCLQNGTRFNHHTPAFNSEALALHCSTPCYCSTPLFFAQAVACITACHRHDPHGLGFRPFRSWNPVFIAIGSRGFAYGSTAEKAFARAFGAVWEQAYSFHKLTGHSKMDKSHKVSPLAVCHARAVAEHAGRSHVMAVTFSATCGIGVVLVDGPDGPVISSFAPLADASRPAADILPNGTTRSSRSNATNLASLPSRSPPVHRWQPHPHLRLRKIPHSRSRGHVRCPWPQPRRRGFDGRSRARASEQRRPRPRLRYFRAFFRI